jgi:RimJ/RimL family protein N-acetyltransferase
VLEGKLVRLRAPEPGDSQMVHYWMNDPEVTEHLTARYPLATSDEFWLAGSGPITFSLVRLAIETKDGEHIGGINLHQIDAESRNAGLGIIIGGKAYWDQGYGSDAIVTLLRFGFHEMNLNRVWLHVYDFNERAQACYKKVGFVVEGTLRENSYREGRYVDTIAMGILRDEFEALHGGGGGGGGSDA